MGWVDEVSDNFDRADFWPDGSFWSRDPGASSSLTDVFNLRPAINAVGRFCVYFSMLRSPRPPDAATAEIVSC
jgi:hypothetical protein